MPPAAPPRPFQPLAWSRGAVLIATLFGAVLLARHVAGPAGIAGALGGAMIGLFAPIFGDLGRAALAGAAALAALALSAVTPHWAGIVLIVPALASLAAWEVATTGHRSFVLAIFAWIVGFAPVRTGLAPDLLACFIAAVLLGLAVAWALGISGRLPGRRGGRTYGIGLFIFLWAGLAATLTVVGHLGNPHAIWVALLFAMRGLTPPGAHAIGTLRFGIGNVLGAGIAGVCELAGMPHDVMLIVGPLLLVAGLRQLGAPSVLAPTLLTAGVLLAIAPTLTSAVFRVEAAVSVALLAEAFAWLVDRRAALTA